MITDLQIEQSLFTWLQSSSLAEDFHTGDPDQFDPNRADTGQWIFVTVNRVKQNAQHSTQRSFPVVINVDVNSKQQDASLGAPSMVDKVVTALTDGTTGQGVSIPIYDYTQDPAEKIGLLMIHEYESQKDLPKVWQKTRLTFTAVAESLA